MDDQFSILNSQFTSTPQSVLIAMSGGVDSTVAAMIAKQRGFDCAGAVMKLYPGAEVSCGDAKAAVAQLDIPLHVFDFTGSFSECVIDRFISMYREGRTPNPCIECNKSMKFGLLLNKALELGKSCLITGHYARICRDREGRYLLKKGADAEKDQSYVLYSLTQKQLAHIIFPLGELSKRQVRSLATEAGLGNARKRESQDICFVSDGDYSGFIAGYTGEPPRKGRFIDADGNFLGVNNGISGFTIGQRRGLGLAMPYPPYVTDIRPEDDTVVVGRHELLYSKTLYAADINLIPFDKISSPLRATVKIRYMHAGQPATVHQTGDDTLFVEFDEPQRAITKGQAAVIYQDDIVIGGGTIIGNSEVSVNGGDN